MRPGCALVENLTNQRNFPLDQCIDLREPIGSVERGNAGRDPIEIDPIECGVMLAEHVAGAA